MRRSEMAFAASVPRERGCLVSGRASGQPRFLRVRTHPGRWLGAVEGSSSQVGRAAAGEIQSQDLALPCNFCHTGVDKGDDAKIPPVDFCMKCHKTIKADSPEIAKLREASEKGKDIAWVPVYTVPDFVFFGHSTHIKAGLHCVECHGPVEKRDVLQKEVPTSMNFCRDCHQQRGARSDCATCHQLGY